MVRKTSGSGVVVHGYEMLGLFIPPPSFLFFVCSCKVCSLSFISVFQTSKKHRGDYKEKTSPAKIKEREDRKSVV